MSWGAVGGLAGAAIGAFGNKQKGPSLADNMNTMYSTWGNAQSANLAKAFQDSGGPQYYPGQTLADQSPQTIAAIQALFNRGANGNPALTAAMDSNTATSRGDYLNSNPTTAGLQDFAGGKAVGANPAQAYFQNATNGAYLGSNPFLSSMFNAASSDVTRNFRNSIAPGLASAFAMAGRTGSGASQGAFSDASNNLLSKLNDLSSNIYGTAYENERNRQQGAASALAGINQFDRTQQLAALNSLSNNYNTARQQQQAANALAPALAAQDWQNIQSMLEAGGMIDKRNQDVINDARARFDFNQNKPYNFASDFINLISGSPSSKMVGNYPQQPNSSPLLSGVGGAIAGSRLGSIFGSGSTSPSDLISNIFGGQGKSLVPAGTPTDASQYMDFWG